MKIFSIVLTVNFIALCLYSCKNAQEQKQTIPQAAPILKTTKVLSLQPIKPVMLPGELHPWNKVQIYSKIKGFVRLVKVDRGTWVKKGQVLAVLDAPEAISELDQSRGQLYAAEALAVESKARLYSSKSTYQRLLKASTTKGAIAVNELDQTRAKMHGDSAAVSSAEGNLRAAKSHYLTKYEMVNYLTITAPFDGIIIERNISPGALIGSGESSTKPLFVLEDNSTLRLTVAIPEQYTNSVHKSDTVTFKVNAMRNQDFKAVFGRSSESVLEKNRVMMIEFDVNNKNGLLKSGMYAEVQLPTQRSAPTLFVPKSAVVSSSEKVFVIRTKHNKAEWVTVQKGITIDSSIEVYGDLSAGEYLVKEASEEIREGSNIQLINP